MHRREEQRSRATMAWIAAALIAATAFLTIKGLGIVHLDETEEAYVYRIALAKWPPYDLLYLADELGYFEEEGVRVELVEFSTQGDCRRAFERGQVDIMSASSLELVMASVFSKRNPKAFVVIDESLGGDALVAAKRLHSLRDLAGKRIGVESGTVNILLLHEALKRAKLTASQVEIVNLTQAEMADALAGDKVDAICTYYPYVEKAVERGGHILFTSLEAPGVIIDMLATDAEFLDSRSDDIVAITRAYLRVVDYAEQNPYEAHKFSAGRQGLDMETIREILTDHIRIVSADEQASWLVPGAKADQSTRGAINALKETGYIEEIRQKEFIAPDIFSRSNRE